MDDVEFRKRTQPFARRAMKLTAALPTDAVGRTMGSQVARSATSVGANYRAACRARSRAEFVSKLQIVIEEAEESCYWLELVIEGEILPRAKVAPLLDEANQLTAMAVASRKSAQRKGGD